MLPLAESAIPKRMDRGLALRNLRVDAEFYLLSGLVAQIANMQDILLANAPAPFDYVLMWGGRVSFRLGREPILTNLM